MVAFNRFEDSQERKSPGLDEIQLRSGDVLLVQSTVENLRELKETAEEIKRLRDEIESRQAENQHRLLQLDEQFKIRMILLGAKIFFRTSGGRC